MLTYRQTKKRSKKEYFQQLVSKVMKHGQSVWLITLLQNVRKLVA
jgi:fructose-1,6-bisphosphatase